MSQAGNTKLSTPTPALKAAAQPLTEEIALCLSGGGYRAMIFHVGAIIRLNDSGLLPKLGRISSVSGGSITSAVLGQNWGKLQFDPKGIARNLDVFVNAVRGFARVTVDVGAILKGIFLPGSVNDRVVEAYDKHLFKGTTLQDLPPDGPSFIFNATNIQTGDLWRFGRDYMGDFKVGLTYKPKISLAQAVAASSAFPPVLSPETLSLNPPLDPVEGSTLCKAPFNSEVILSDGGVYDNLGLENPWKRSRTILVSDGGQAISYEPDPHHDWARHALRVLDIIDNQVRSLRTRYLIDAYERGDHNGAFWSIRSNYCSYPASQSNAPDPLGRAGRDPTALAAIHTRLEAMDDATQQKLINWGYAICDAALMSHWDQDLTARYGTVAPATAFPLPGGY
jgi:NTE family protein